MSGPIPAHSKKLTVVVPMYNEEMNVASTAGAIRDTVLALDIPFEVILVNDGSKDNTQQKIDEVKQKYPEIRSVTHPRNYGRGRGLRSGFMNAEGEFVIAMEADLSYHPEHIVRIYEHLASSSGVDIVLGSAYAKGGTVKGVPLFRKMLSRWGNRILTFAFHGKYKTITCTVRGYRRRALQALDLLSDGKELHLEILTKAEDLGLKIEEIPAHLTKRKAGKSKSKHIPNIISHLLFAFSERPSLLFGLSGCILMVAGLAFGIYIIICWRQGRLNPARPLMTLMTICLSTGAIFFFIGFLGREMRYLKKEIHRIQSKLKQIDRF